MCGIVVETEGDAVVSIRGDHDDPFSRGHVCPKVLGLKDIYEDPDRLRTPMKRGQNGEFHPISWDEAFDYASEGLRRVQRSHGRDAVAEYQGNPTIHNFGALMFSPVLLKAVGTRNYFTASSVDQLPHMVASYFMFGHQIMMPVPDLDRTDYMLILGANPLVSNGSLMTAGNVGARLRAILERGGRVVVIDPRRSETAEFASEHHFIRPGSDALFLLAMLHTLFAERLHDLGVLGEHVTGLAEVEQLAARFPPERVADMVGIAAEQIRTLARQFAESSRAVCYGRVGVSTQEYGSLSCWLINVLNIVTGNLDQPGGAMFPRPAVDLVKSLLPLAPKGSFQRWKSRVRGLPEFGGELPVSALAEDMEAEGEGRIRGFLSVAGNPVLSAPSGSRLERALARLDFMVSIDLYINETSRHAHVILPPTSALEQEHYDLALHMVQVRTTAKYSPPCFARKPGTLHDWEIFNELAWRLAPSPVQRLGARAAAMAMAKLTPKGMLRLLLRIGPHGDRYAPFGRGLNMKRLEQSPHGIDLGALEPTLPGRLCTEDRKIALAPALLLCDAERLDRKLAAPQASPTTLSLIGRRELRSKNSWLHNSQRLVKGPVRCTLQMHSRDASERGLVDGAQVTVSSRAGSIELPLEVTDALMPGVVSVPHGWGHARAGVMLRVANAHPGASINDITDDALVDGLSGNAGFSGVPVEIRATQDRLGPMS
jgi:anaerobic selenocysteine-containing dehydrogenase